MKSKKILLVTCSLIFTINAAYAQINLGERALGAIGSGLKALTVSDEEVSAMSLQAVSKMDKDAQIAGPKDPYTIRLNRIFKKHAAENGLTLNYKVYKAKEVNAFATADGSIRVYSGLMDIMDDNELLAVIGHEIGHVANKDSRDAMKSAYLKLAAIDGLAASSDKIASITDSQWGKIGSAFVDSSHSRKQESEADTYSYDFMRKHGYNVNAIESAFRILASLSAGKESDFLSRMMSSHPDAEDRANYIKTRAEADGLYKPYVKAVKTKTPVKSKKPTKKK
jgi:metalloprotease